MAKRAINSIRTSSIRVSVEEMAVATVERYCAISAPDELAGSDADSLFDEWLQSQEFTGYSDADLAEIIDRATDLFPDAADMAVSERLGNDAYGMVIAFIDRTGDDGLTAAALESYIRSQRWRGYTNEQVDEVVSDALEMWPDAVARELSLRAEQDALDAEYAARDAARAAA